MVIIQSLSVSCWWISWIVEKLLLITCWSQWWDGCITASFMYHSQCLFNNKYRYHSQCLHIINNNFRYHSQCLHMNYNKFRYHSQCLHIIYNNTTLKHNWWYICSWVGRISAWVVCIQLILENDSAVEVYNITNPVFLILQILSS